MSEGAAVLEPRLAQREAKRHERKELAERLKDDGNEMFRKGQYFSALMAYRYAMKVYGPRAVYLNNCTAVGLKMENYETAELVATEALYTSPSLLKARFRRGLARKAIGTVEKLKLAMEDFDNCLKQDPQCTEAAMQYEATTSLLLGLQSRPLYERESGHVSKSPYDSSDGESSESHDEDSEESQDSEDSDENITSNTTGPLYTLSDVETDVESVSSDYEHEGKYACKDYNRLGCDQGRECIYRHAPDEQSVRDRVGRNVCLYWLPDTPCKFGSDKCVYAHDRRFLPPGWWDFPGALADYKNTINGFPNRRDFMPVVVAVIAHKYEKREYGSRKDIVIRKAPKKRGKGKGNAHITTDYYQDALSMASGSSNRGRSGKRGNGRGRGRGGGGWTARPRWMDYDEDTELLERMPNMGYTNAEVMELASQGIKFYDSD